MTKYTFQVRLIAIAALFFLLGIFLPSPVLAAEFRQGDNARVGPDEVINDNLYVFGSTIIIDGTINGDLVTAGQTIRISGRVTGSVFAAGQTIIVAGSVGGSFIAAGRTVTVAGSVERSARIAGETLSVSGKVGSDVLAAGSSIDITSTGTINGDLIFSGAESILAGSIGRKVKGRGGMITLAGNIKGDVDVRAEALNISPGSRTEGSLVYTSNNYAKISQGAVVSGSITRKAPEVKAQPGVVSRITGRILSFVVSLLAGIALLFLLPRHFDRVSRAIRQRIWPSLGWGFLSLTGAPMAIILVLVSSIVITVLRLPVAIIGIPLSIIAAALLVLAIYLSQVIAGMAIGREVVGYGRALDTKGREVLALTTGLAILAVLKAVPYLGVLVSVAAMLFGVGAIIASVRMSGSGKDKVV